MASYQNGFAGFAAQDLHQRHHQHGGTTSDPSNLSNPNAPYNPYAPMPTTPFSAQPSGATAYSYLPHTTPYDASAMTTDPMYPSINTDDTTIGFGGSVPFYTGEPMAVTPTYGPALPQQQHQQQPPPYTGPAATSNPTVPAGALPSSSSSSGAGGYSSTSTQFLNDLAPSFGVNPSAAAFGLEVGSRFVEGQLNYMQSNMSKYATIQMLKYYFDVDTIYVLKKLKRMYRPPFLGRNTKMFERRGHAAADDTIIYAPPREDVSAPDLYIPLMALITYVMLVGLNYGVANRFQPEVMYSTLLSAISTVILESLVLKLALYLFTTVKSVPYMDLVAYSGYSFVGVAVNMLAYLIFGSVGYYLAWLTNSIFMATFLLRTMRIIVPPGSGVALNPSINTRQCFLLGVAVLQFLVTFFLGLTVTSLASATVPVVIGTTYMATSTMPVAPTMQATNMAAAANVVPAIPATGAAVPAPM